MSERLAEERLAVIKENISREWLQYRGDWRCDLRLLTDEIDALHLERDRAVADSRRLDWWLSRKLWLRAPGKYGAEKRSWRVYLDADLIAHGNSPRDAIDAAMLGNPTVNGRSTSSSVIFLCLQQEGGDA